MLQDVFEVEMAELDVVLGHPVGDVFYMRVIQGQ
jgi:hypothetical protein